jgi:DNA-binding NarL/FixJ family response regulator
MAGATVRLILAEPQTLTRAMLRHYIAGLDGIEVVAEAENGATLIEQVGMRQPDLVLSEFSLPDVRGLDLTQTLRRHFPMVGVAFLGNAVDPGLVRAVLNAGASAFLSRSSEPLELELALRAHSRGQVYISPSISRRVIERRGRRVEGSGVLTRRQREVLRMVGRGKTTKEIAQLLGLSAKTVETHRARLMQTLGLRSCNALMHFAVTSGAQSAE